MPRDIRIRNLQASDPPTNLYVYGFGVRITRRQSDRSASADTLARMRVLVRVRASRARYFRLKFAAAACSDKVNVKFIKPPITNSNPVTARKFVGKNWPDKRKPSRRYCRTKGAASAVPTATDKALSTTDRVYEKIRSQRRVYSPP